MRKMNIQSGQGWGVSMLSIIWKKLHLGKRSKHSFLTLNISTGIHSRKKTVIVKKNSMKNLELALYKIISKFPPHLKDKATAVSPAKVLSLKGKAHLVKNKTQESGCQ